MASRPDPCGTIHRRPGPTPPDGSPPGPRALRAASRSIWPTLFALIPILIFVACAEPPPEPPPGVTAEVLAPRVEAYLKPYLDAGLFHGVLLIARGDDVLLHKAYGRADAEAYAPNGLGTRFRLASLTKTFTSAAAIVLRDQGRLSFDDTLSKYIDDFPQGERITIKHLLSHASGVSNPDDSLLDGGEVPLADLVENIRSKPLLFEPGTDDRYSNGGYNLLAFVIEKASGSTYDAFLRKSFFDPLEMYETGHFGTEVPAPLFARGHTPGPDPNHPIRTPLPPASAMLGSGSLSSTTGDLYRWARAVARKEKFSLDGLDWPYGWGKSKAGEHEGISQTGGTTGFVTSLTVFPEEEIFIVCLNNLEAGAWVRWSEDLARIAFGEEVAPHDLPAEVAVDPEQLDIYAGTYRSEDGDRWRVVNDGGLFMHWNDRPVGKYLTPIGEGRFQPRSDTGTITFEGDDRSKPPARLVWDLGESSMTFTRQR